MEKEKILRFCSLAAKLTLESGGETYRAEELITRSCKSFGYENANVLAVPTGIFISIEDGETSLVRIEGRTTDLFVIDEVNRVARDLIGGNINIDDACSTLMKITKKAENKAIKILSNGASSAFFALLFGGAIFDAIFAFLCGCTHGAMSYFIKHRRLQKFAQSLFGGLTVGAYAVLYTFIFKSPLPSSMILGAMMPLLPGLAMTNAIRDTIAGDLVSGVSRFAEAIVVALALAVGVASMLIMFSVY